jgi:hypothetical protein
MLRGVSVVLRHGTVGFEPVSPGSFRCQTGLG